MRKKVILDESTICSEYLNERVGVETLALKYHTGKKKIKEILGKNGIGIKKRGKQPLTGNFVLSDWKIEKYPKVEGKFYVAVDRNDGFTTTDYKNKAGVLTSHIKEKYSIDIPTLYDRRVYYMRTGNYWWEQWFDIILKDKVQTKKCPYCNWETKDINNLSGVFEVHLNKKHCMTKFEYLEEHPEDRDYFALVSPILNRQMETNPDNYVICKICGKKVSHIGGNHIKSHNMTLENYVSIYGDKDIVCKNFHDSMSKFAIKANTEMTPVKSSKDELEIKRFIEKHGVLCKPDRSILNGREIDIFIPSMNIGIEYNGNKWHTEFFGKKNRYYHISKKNDCLKKGVRLIQIFEDEYTLHKDIVMSKLSHILGFDGNKPKIYGRKCEIRTVLKSEADIFLEKYHIQGTTHFTVSLGAYYNAMLIGVMCFCVLPDNNWELVRFASDYHFRCSGVGGKLFKYFVSNYEFNEIKSFADRRWTINEEDNLYTKLGFINDGVTKPSFTYYFPKLYGCERKHKLTLKKTKMLKEHPEFEGMTEKEMTQELGYDRIWDCGLIRYIYRNS